MDVSKNSGTPKSSILIGFSIINHPFWGTPIFGNTHIYLSTGFKEFFHQPPRWAPERPARWAPGPTRGCVSKIEWITSPKMAMPWDPQCLARCIFKQATNKQKAQIMENS